MPVGIRGGTVVKRDEILLISMHPPFVEAPFVWSYGKVVNESQHVSLLVCF